ncbi:PIN domain-containing protein [Sphaerisporangium rhizosphaerae]|uniref:LppX_LprAFG lipoprotein n=1 Tax=Sphaerisporangium rhizosphaerae TaxID=2269375 RepID=A0ABW2P0X4_9ACTN
MRTYVLIAVLAVLVAGCGTGPKTAPEIAGYVETYLQAHHDVRRVATKGVQSATVVIRGQDQDVSADLGEGFRGRLIQTGGTGYTQMLGEEVAPGKPWDKITKEHEPYNLLGIDLLTNQAITLVNSHRVHALLAATGRASGPASDGGLDHYTVTIDMRKALNEMDLDAFLEVYDPLPWEQDTADEYAKVRAGDKAAQKRLRDQLLKEFGARATYELWLDDQGRPVRQRLNAKTPMEITFSDWDATTVIAPPADQVRVLTGPFSAP